jgi:CheY-like chemotaxis protein
VRISVTSRAADVTITATDTGAGIPRAFLPYVFDRFRQSEGGTTRHHGGLGLGLAIVRHLVELHGGTVYAESAGPGQGATFRVVLPRTLTREAALASAPADASIRENTHPAEAALTGVRVLVVDDDTSSRELFEAIVQNAGGEMRSVGSVAEAMALLRAWWPDVLLSDIEMPDQDGYMLLEEVRRLSASHASLPAVAVTAHSRPEDRARALEAGFHWHLSKPVEPSQVVGILASLTGRLDPIDSPEVRG